MGKKKILLIDDEKELCKMVKLNLESTGEFEVTTVYSGEEGIERTKEMQFDLVMTDYSMPGMDGKAVLDTLKATKPLLPIILFSVYHDDSSTITSSTKTKADGLISKPFGHKELYNKIKEVLAGTEQK